MSLYSQLPSAEREAVERVRRELFPAHSHEAVVLKLIRDGLIGMGVMPLPSGNRSRGARSATKALPRSSHPAGQSPRTRD